MERITRPWRFSFFRGDRGWGQLRFLGALAGVAVFVLLNAALEVWLRSPWTDYLLRAFFFGLPPAGLELLTLLAGVFRHAITPVLGIVLAIAAATFYIQDIYEFPSFEHAFGYLFASLFGTDYPSLTIQDGKPKMDKDEHNTVWKIGGPGTLDIKLGNAVLLERGFGATRVLGAGRHFIRRFETIRDIRDLREIYRLAQNVEATTKDGIKIVIRDVEATFRAHTDDQSRTERQPYPFTPEALHAAAYNRAVGKNGEQPEWEDAVMGAITGRIRGWVARQRLDRLTAPLDEDPRAAIRAEFASPEARQQFQNLGAEWVWVNLGHLDTPDDVDAQRLLTWRSFWEAHDLVTKAHGEALRVAYAELGRAEGQAEMLVAISQALQGVGPGNVLDDRFAELVLLRIGRVLEAMAAPPWLSEPDTGKALEAPEPSDETGLEPAC